MIAWWPWPRLHKNFNGYFESGWMLESNMLVHSRRSIRNANMPRPGFSGFGLFPPTLLCLLGLSRRVESPDLTTKGHYGTRRPPTEQSWMRWSVEQLVGAFLDRVFRWSGTKMSWTGKITSTGYLVILWADSG